MLAGIFRRLLKGGFLIAATLLPLVAGLNSTSWAAESTTQITNTAILTHDGGIVDSNAVVVTVTHSLVVTAAANPQLVAPSSPTSLTASYVDNMGHEVASWTWSDGGAGGQFSPSALVQNPTYIAPPNTSGTIQTVSLTVTATCDGPDALQDTRSVQVLVGYEGLGSIFADVPTDYWAWRYIEACYRAGVTMGCTTSPLQYCPAATVTRAQMAVFICRAARKSPMRRADQTFSDVPDTHWAFEYIERLADSSSWGGRPVTSGCAADDPTTPENEARFCPDDPVTREQMAAFLCNATGKSGLAFEIPTFADVPESNPFQPWIERLADRASWCYGAVTAGCATGPPRLYCPHDSVTRAQMAVFLVLGFCLPR